MRTSAPVCENPVTPQNQKRIPTQEEVMEKLQESTRRYINCADPTEAAARRIRVSAEDATTVLEETAARIVVATSLEVGELREATTPPVNQMIATQQYRQTPTRESIMLELQEVTKQYLSCADPIEAAARHKRVNTEEAIRDMEKTADSMLETALLTAEAPSAQPFLLNQAPNSVEPPALTQQRDADHRERINMETKRDKETEVNTRSKRRGRPATGKSSTRIPNILRGTSSKKRTLARLQQSPRSLSQNPHRAAETRPNGNGVGPSRDTANPPIQLIPAASRKRKDFWVASKPAP